MRVYVGVYVRMRFNFNSQRELVGGLRLWLLNLYFIKLYCLLTYNGESASDI